MAPVLADRVQETTDTKWDVIAVAQEA